MRDAKSVLDFNLKKICSGLNESLRIECCLRASRLSSDRDGASRSVDTQTSTQMDSAECHLSISTRADPSDSCVQHTHTHSPKIDLGMKRKWHNGTPMFNVGTLANILLATAAHVSQALMSCCMFGSCVKGCCLCRLYHLFAIRCV